MTWQSMTTAEKIEAIRPFVEKDATASETGRALGCSRNAIIGMWHRHGDILGRVKVTNAKRAKEGRVDIKPGNIPAEPRPAPVEPRKTAWLRPVLKMARARPEAASGQGDGKPVRLIDTDAFHCRWIDGDPSSDATCCGALRVSETSPYCAAHHARAYVKAPPRKSVRKAPDNGDRRPGACDRAFYRG